MTTLPPIFFIDSLPIQQNRITLPETITHHLRVRRDLEKGYEFILSTGEHYVYACLVEITKKYASAEFGEIADVPPRSTDIHLYQSVLKPESMAWVCQKATELGVSSIQPLITERVQGHHWSNHTPKHLEKIIESAATQSRQLQLPVLKAPSTLSQCPWPTTHTWIAADFGGQPWPTQRKLGPLGILIGPEGGWSTQDRTLLPVVLTRVQLTQTILRAETAAIACLSLAFCS